MTNRSVFLHMTVLTLALAGCEGRDKYTAASAAPPAAALTVGGTLSGLAAGESVVLKVNGVDPQSVSAGGHFAYSVIAPNLDGTYPYGALIFAPHGTLHGLTNTGGTINDGAVIEFN